MSKITDIEYGVHNDIKYRFNSMGWYGYVDVYILPVTKGVYHIHIDFNTVLTENIGSGSDGEDEYNNSLLFHNLDERKTMPDGSKELILLDIAFGFKRPGHFYGQMHKKMYSGTFYEESIYDTMFDDKPMKRIKLGE